MKPTYKMILQNYFHRFQAAVSMAAFSENLPDWNQAEIPDYHRYWYIRSGEGWLVMDDQTYEIKPGRLYVLPAGSSQSFGTDSNTGIEMYWCHFRAAIGDLEFLHQLKFPISVEIDDHKNIESIFERMIQSYRSQSLTKELRLRSAMLDLMAAYLDHCKLNDITGEGIELVEKMDPVLRYIEEHIRENIKVDKLASIAYLHPNYFIGFFKNVVGCSPIQYVNGRRLENAKRLLEETTASVADIAKQVGMQNHYLSRLFKQYIGLTPSRYRQLYRMSAASSGIKEGSEELS
ncbi:AraC family transcriptional regulator [Paenibacillus spongiae]|uniref:AraC family transcriptional regulator n=1 Tax=Paenibacillus spongiae TaxID=2909671 RepID=A0ABY5S5S7_9BACL|nr:AraC family transcriptional regulator [Paenibacillus spongiae]UVI28838.1 AraC family transcriptional regulator [Paenibacillus spongiae]